ncbi:hypothetical protein ACFWY9_08340 [Amycolatopsis sp. NPDC059027]|uniref:hypothetical protein n=1 Tax=unclassified Amycolatopsis TaxID=2618356 RepID=UPI00366E9650
MPGTPEPDPVRAEGPPVVVHGVPGGRRVLVLDPAGASKHDELPATWRPFTEDREIVWARLPVDGALHACEHVLAHAGGPLPVTDIVASGPYGEEALLLAEHRPSVVRSVLLVDPAAEGFLEAERARAADADWLRDHGNRVAGLRDAGVEVEIVAHSTGDAGDRVPAPLPLGHPDVVSALVDAFDRLPAVRRPAL